MSTEVRTTNTGRTGTASKSGGVILDWAVALTSAWLLGGIWLDAWAHHNLPETLESFFTPWHGLLYSGFAATAAVLLTALARGRIRGGAWRGALPAGYGLSVLGVVVFMLGGAGDMLWHLIFGIEVDLEALLSPTHLLLALGGALIVSGPFRAARASQQSTPGSHWPMLLSLALTVSVFTFFTEYANPFGLPWPAKSLDVTGSLSTLGASGAAVSSELGQMLGVTAILLQAGLLTGAALMVARGRRLPFGALTLLIGLNVSLAAVPHGYYLFIPAGVLAGLAADLMLRGLTPMGIVGLRVFALAAPATLFALYFLTLTLAGGVSWPVELWSGVILLSGFVGFLISYLAYPQTVRGGSARS
jgi:hypothetical protein